MTLYSTLRMSANTLQANQIGMQVISQNIANANTEGYLREEIVYSPAPTQEYGGLLLGLGVEVEAIVQKVDYFLEDRLRSSTSDLSGSEIVEDTYAELEGILNELEDSDLSTSLNDFFSSISEILNQPESVSVRNLAVLEGQGFAQDVTRLAERVTTLRTDLNDQIDAVGERINDLTEQIRTLNVQIAETEGGDVSHSDAVGLRDQRLVALQELGSLIDIHVEEQESGATNVYAGGDYLVFEGTRREVEIVQQTDRGIATSEIYISETYSPLDVSSGKLAGLTEARDDVLGDFVDQLNDFAATVIFEFNKAYSSGQGLQGYDEITSEFSVDEADVPLNEAGLTFTPGNGSFQVMLYNEETGLTETTEIRVDLNGEGDDTTLEELVDQLDAIDGISASITSTRQLEISSDSPDQQIGFAEDTSGILAALGFNTFFTGTDALSIGVSEAVQDDPALFAASQSGIGADTENAVLLADLADQEIDSANGKSIRDLYDTMANDVAQGSAMAQSEAEGNRVFQQTLYSQKLAVSGVSIDEEVVKMISYQQSYNAAARVITVLNEMLDTLLAL